MQSLNLKSIPGSRRLTSAQATEVAMEEGGVTFLAPAEDFGELLQAHRKWLDSLSLYGPGFRVADENSESAKGEPADFRKVDLRHANLPGVPLAGAMLEGAHFNHANLTRACFSGANLSGAQLAEIYAQGIQLQCANLSGADMKGGRVEDSDLGAATLEGAQMQGCALSRSNLMMARMQGADLYGAFLKGVDLRWADLRGVNLQMVNLQKANLEGADLRGADLRGADLYGAILTHTHLGGANLQGVDMLGAKLEGAKLKGALMSGSDLHGAKLQGADLKGAKLQKSKAEEWQLQDKKDATLTLLERTAKVTHSGVDRVWILYLILALPLATIALAAFLEHWNAPDFIAYAESIKKAIGQYQTLLVDHTLQPALSWVERSAGFGFPPWVADLLIFHCLVGGAILLLMRRQNDIVPTSSFATRLGNWIGGLASNVIVLITWPLLVMVGLMGVDRKRLLPLSMRGLMFLGLTAALYAVLLAVSSLPTLLTFR